jgi:hypothetical protein
MITICVAFHPGSVTQFPVYDVVNAESPFILFLDPLDCHSSTEICYNVYSCLDAEWNKKHTKTIKMCTPLTMQAFSPAGKTYLLCESTFFNLPCCLHNDLFICVPSTKAV